MIHESVQIGTKNASRRVLISARVRVFEPDAMFPDVPAAAWLSWPTGKSLNGSFTDDVGSTPTSSFPHSFLCPRARERVSFFLSDCFSYVLFSVFFSPKDTVVRIEMI